MNEMIDMWKKNKMNTFGIIYSWFLAKVFFWWLSLQLAIVVFLSFDQHCYCYLRLLANLRCYLELSSGWHLRKQ
jgi:hypothetical protein